MSSKINIKKYSMSVQIPAGNFSDARLQHWAKVMRDSLKKSILSDLFNSRQDNVIYRTSRFTVVITRTSKVSIYDYKNNVEWVLQDVKDNPKNFTKAIVKRVPFFELYEKTQ